MTSRTVGKQLPYPFKDNVLGSILGCKKTKSFFPPFLSLLYRLSIQISLIIDQFTVKRKNPFNKAQTDETVKDSKFRGKDVFN